MRRRGYSRLELLCALGVVTLLASIYVPFARHRRWQANLSNNTHACAGNLRALTLSMLMYAQDQEDYYPTHKATLLPAAQGGGKYFGWADAIRPYVGADVTYHCPQSSARRQQRPAPRSSDYVDYFFNRNLSAHQRNLLHPQRVVMLGDAPPGNARSASNGCKNTPCSAAETGQPATLPSSARRHMGGAMYGFADGHVAWIEAQSDTSSREIMSGNTPPAPGNYTFGIGTSKP